MKKKFERFEDDDDKEDKKHKKIITEIQIEKIEKIGKKEENLDDPLNTFVIKKSIRKMYKNKHH